MNKARNFTISSEKIIISACILPIMFVVAYSFGVRKGRNEAFVKTTVTTGKTIAISQTPDKISTEEKRNNVNIIEIPRDTGEIAGTEELLREKAEKKDTPEDYGYIIQLVTYTLQNNSAQREKQLLEQKGYNVIITNTGKHIVVSVGGFNNRDAAENELLKLRKRYKDCYIRRRT